MLVRRAVNAAGSCGIQKWTAKETVGAALRSLNQQSGSRACRHRPQERSNTVIGALGCGSDIDAIVSRKRDHHARRDRAAATRQDHRRWPDVQGEPAYRCARSIGSRRIDDADKIAGDTRIGG